MSTSLTLATQDYPHIATTSLSALVFSRGVRNTIGRFPGGRHMLSEGNRGGGTERIVRSEFPR